jgi:ribosomal protein S12 methylthiotransferase
MTINLITLGCSKNLVDSEKLLHQLRENGHEVFHNSDEYTDGLIINTCGFILDAKTESIETILEYAEAKKSGFIGKIIVMGCLSERYKESLKTEIPEVDGFFGVNDIDRIVNVFEGNYYAELLHKRILQTPGHYAYLKISEGCNRQCAFCAIPGIRGRQVSLSIESLVKEARELAERGVKELILIAQELTSYGVDIYKRKALPDLIKELLKIPEFEWIRLHYAYPDGFPTEEIIALMKENPRICRYLDIPVQHASNSVLKRMKRGHSREDIEEIITKFRSELPDISIRTTLITGFPGETPEDFQELKHFISKTRFDRLGVFPYSHEEGTPAFNLKDDIPEKTKEKRVEELMEIQEKISLEKNLSRVGQNMKIIIDRKEGEFYIGRTEYDSPEVDNEVLIPSENIRLKTGHFYRVNIFDAIEYDLYGKVIE